jgi:hypothetical protein
VAPAFAVWGVRHSKRCEALIDVLLNGRGPEPRSLRREIERGNITRPSCGVDAYLLNAEGRTARSRRAPPVAEEREFFHAPISRCIRSEDRPTVALARRENRCPRHQSLPRPSVRDGDRPIGTLLGRGATESAGSHASCTRMVQGQFERTRRRRARRHLPEGA